MTSGDRPPPESRSPQVTLVMMEFAGSPQMVRTLEKRLSRRFGLDFVLRDPWFDVEDCLDVTRGQYDSRMFLERLISQAKVPGDKILGITSVDLFIPILTFVFGEAQLGGSVSVVSSHRLDNAVYGLPYSESLLVERLDKEATHELGHTFGLAHCAKLECVMHSSTYVEEIDLKGADFCPDCRVSLTRGENREPAASTDDLL
jgi:archaemetzincin